MSREFLDDRELLERFEGAELSEDCWDHRAHVRVAFQYLRRLGLERALPEMRAKIRGFNERIGIPNTDRRGYHETVTVAFLVLIDHAMQGEEAGSKSESSRDFCDRHPELLGSGVLGEFYSNERLGDPEGRRVFLAPDRKPLPGDRAPLGR